MSLDLKLSLDLTQYFLEVIHQVMSLNVSYETTLKIRAEVGDTEISFSSGEEFATKMNLLSFKRCIPSHYIIEQ